uniref:Ig-like domain-containing protein n=1 Tax=Esox lucius TaxID=8010 RepID=A0A3P8Y7H1_ESOLU
PSVLSNSGSQLKLESTKSLRCLPMEQQGELSLIYFQAMPKPHISTSRLHISTSFCHLLSGYEEMKCTTRDVYPAPHVSWATDPPAARPLRPITRKISDRKGLYVVDSRLRKLQSQSEITYICTVNSSYGTQAWTASVREREIRGEEGKDLTIPCKAPPHLHHASLSWSFTNHSEPALILTYDSRSRHTSALMPWEGRMHLDPLRVSLGDGSLRLVKPESREHTGVYTCVYAAPQMTHTENTGVKIISAGTDSPRWWTVAVVIAALALALTGILIFLKVRGTRHSNRQPHYGTLTFLCLPEIPFFCRQVTSPRPVRDQRTSVRCIQLKVSYSLASMWCAVPRTDTRGSKRIRK